ncbi:hypothetical protein M3J09_007477 [Ascochyta lentis]
MNDSAFAFCDGKVIFWSTPLLLLRVTAMEGYVVGSVIQLQSHVQASSCSPLATANYSPGTWQKTVRLKSDVMVIPRLESPALLVHQNIDTQPFAAAVCTRQHGFTGFTDTASISVIIALLVTIGRVYKNLRHAVEHNCVVVRSATPFRRVSRYR